MINPVSFGKIVKVNVPYNIAQQIIEKSKEDNKEGQELKDALFDEGDNNEAEACFCDGASYIFTGRELQRRNESRESAEKVREQAEEENTEDAWREFGAAWQNFDSEILGMIKSYSESSRKKEIAVKLDGENIKSIEVVA